MKEPLDDSPVGPVVERNARIDELRTLLGTQQRRAIDMEQWVLENTAHPEWLERLSHLQWEQASMYITRQRIENLQNGQPEMGNGITHVSPNPPRR